MQVERVCVRWKRQQDREWENPVEALTTRVILTVKVDQQQVDDVKLVKNLCGSLRAVHCRVERVVAHRQHGHERRRLGRDKGDVVEHRGAVDAVVVSCRRTRSSVA